jgi:hypothetical protein
MNGATDAACATYSSADGADTAGANTGASGIQSRGAAIAVRCRRHGGKDAGDRSRASPDASARPGGCPDAAATAHAAAHAGANAGANARRRADSSSSGKYGAEPSPCGKSGPGQGWQGWAGIQNRSGSSGQ